MESDGLMPIGPALYAKSRQVVTSVARLPTPARFKGVVWQPSLPGKIDESRLLSFSPFLLPFLLSCHNSWPLDSV